MHTFEGGMSMKFVIRITLISLVIILAAFTAYAQETGALQYAELGDYHLQNGQVIQECRLAYRTFGSLNASKSNAILFPTWLIGTSQDLVELGFIGPGKLADSSKYFIIAVDSLGNGISSSPSNSKKQPGQKFPQYTIRDMVNIEHLLITHHLQLPQLYAVIGISMGGMQTLQWMVSYPYFMNKAVAISASPQLTSYDLLLWQTELDAIDAIRGTEQQNSLAMKIIADIQNLHSRTPRYVATHTTPEVFPQFLIASEKSFMKYNVNDWAWQLKAVMTQDIYKPFGSSEEQTARAIRAHTMIIWALQDYMVYPEPVKALAKLVNAETFELTGDCGHFAFLCEGAILQETVNSFLLKK
jgi:homoserine O-acetyltransferase